MTEFFRRKMAFFRQVHAFVVRTVRSLAGAIRVTDAVAGNAQAVVVEGDAWVRNQLIQNGDFSDGLTNWQNHAGSMSILSVDGGRLKVTLPQDGRYGFSQNLSPSIPANHTVLYVFNGVDLSHLSATNISMQVITNGDVWNSTKQNIGSSSNITLYWRRTTAAPVTAITLRCATGNQPGDYYTVSAVQIIDLTQLCNGDAAKIAAITSWADLVAQYPEYASYVAYNTGEVVGLQSTVVARGRNLIDDRIKYNPSQTWTLIGSTTLGGGALLPPGKYYWNVYYNGGAMPSGVTPYISYNGRTEYRPHSFTLTEPSYVHCRIYPSQQNTAWSSYTAQVELGSEATPYEPSYYGGTASTQTLYAAGTAHDAQDVVSGEVTRRVGSYTFTGEESWTRGTDSGNPSFARVVFKMFNIGKYMTGIKTVSYTALANIQHNKYSADIVNNLIRTDATIKGIGLDYTTLIIADDSITDTTTLQAALTGTTIYYELATPTTSTVTAQPLALQKGSNSIYQTDAGRTASFEMTYTATQ